MTHIEMAREAGFMLVTDPDPDTGGWWECFDSEIETLVTLVRADERKIVMNEPLTKEMWQRFEDEIRADEREACYTIAKFNQSNHLEHLTADQIKARGEIK